MRPDAASSKPHRSPLDYRPSGSRRGLGLLIVLLVHAFIVWGLFSALSHKALPMTNKPIEMKIVAEAAPLPPPPPPPPPPKLEKLREPPKPAAPPPPPYMPPSELPPPVAAPAPVVQATQPEPPKAAPVIAPPPPPAPPVAPPAPARAEVGVVCPGHDKVLQAALSGQYDRVGVEGTVSVRLKVHDGQVVEVTPLSGPREYYRAVQAAARRFTCTKSDVDQITSLDVVFRQP